MGINEMRALEAACQAHIQALEASIDLGQMADVQMLCAALARQRRRPIHLEASQLPADVAGAWLATATADYIFYVSGTTPPHQEHIILHEVAHLLCGHHALSAEVDTLQRDWFPHLDAGIIRSALSRVNYSRDEEREAELLASLIEQRWLAKRPLTSAHEGAGARQPETRRLRHQVDEFWEKLRGD